MSAAKPKAVCTTCLLADDYRSTRHMIKHFLGRDNCQVIEAENGREALEKYQHFGPDLVLLDIFMPVMDGLEVCAQIKKLPEGNFTPVLMFTSLEESNFLQKAFEAGADDFITKPINQEELHHRIQRLLYLRSLEIKRVTAERELRSNYEKIKMLSSKVINAHEEERIRLARELHDEVGMALTTVKLELQLLDKNLSEIGVGLEDKLTSSIKLMDNSLDLIRAKAASLRPPALDDLGLVAVARNMVNELNRLTGINIDFKATGERINLTLEYETCLFRCLQEALTNVARHSYAKRGTVEITWKAKEVSIRVMDDGIGFDPGLVENSAGQLGIKGMKERVALLGGSINIDSSTGKGTEVNIKLLL